MTGYTTEEPIYALATPFSPSALAVIRTSGTSSISLVEKVFKGRLKDRPSGTAVHGWIVDKNREKVDEVVALVYTSGHGYTGEEAVEIMCHGSLPVIRKISTTLEEAGFRLALRGEFTYRAFLGGRMDLTEAEAVEELVSAKGERGRKDALSRLSGSIRREADKAKDEIISILASLEVQLDYGEDDIPEDWIFPEERVEEIIDRLELIRRTYASSRLYSQGAKVVLAGSTNAGKSSLFNALLKENRAIVSSVAGTTRDYIETQCEMKGIPIRLFDTAGLRTSGDEIEIEGISRSKELMDDADLVVYVLAPGESEPEEKLDNAIYIHSKSDIAQSDGITFSSVTGEGLDEVVDEITGFLSRENAVTSDVPVIESERQERKLGETIDALRDAEKSKDCSVDIIALYFQAALSALSELTGETTGEDVLEVLFSSFCLGK
ncbi:MAG: tRNA uridine-5-carboxymethylaminomethyl(34) synthesis GTPase MnmE [Spirochaetales bacterium]|nr:tRNA uridine-5-carboxymethylaminomethyl(34) synthesis GTPase MnmE [Spirochaetales bacterium]